MLVKSQIAVGWLNIRMFLEMRFSVIILLVFEPVPNKPLLIFLLLSFSSIS